VIPKEQLLGKHVVVTLLNDRDELVERPGIIVQPWYDWDPLDTDGVTNGRADIIVFLDGHNDAAAVSRIPAPIGRLESSVRYDVNGKQQTYRFPGHAL